MTASWFSRYAAGMTRVGRSLVMAIAAAAGVAGAQHAPATVHGFETDRVGAPPAGFVFATMRQADPTRWFVRRDGASNVLVHEADSTGGRGAALAVLQRPTWRDGDVSVRMRLLGGDRTGGLVWRYRDAENHSLVQFALKAQSIGLYRIADGNRIRLEEEDDLELDPDAWHTLKVAQRDRRVRIYLGGVRVFEERNRGDAVPGSVGIWCSGGTVAQFDDLRVTTPE
ncbi:MAG: hypothetical protein AB7Q29_13115 [Vicinamibacterales bacterium]